MVYESNVRRVTLTGLLVLWLSVQTLVIGISPSWGFVLPHDHVTRGFLSASAWQAHLREHQLGVRIAFAQPCDPLPSTGASVMASVPTSAGAFSFVAVAVPSWETTTLKISAPDAPQAKLQAADFYAFQVPSTPLEPPPTA